MKNKHLIIFISLVLFLYPGTVFPGEWTWQNSLPQGNVLSAVWGSSGSDVFAVGGGAAQYCIITGAAGIA